MMYAKLIPMQNMPSNYPTLSQYRAWHEDELIDANYRLGEKTETILRHFFERSSATISVVTLAAPTGFEPNNILVLCRRLAVLNILEERPIQSRIFRLSKDARSLSHLQEIAEKHGWPVPSAEDLDPVAVTSRLQEAVRREVDELKMG